MTTAATRERRSWLVLAGLVLGVAALSQGWAALNRQSVAQTLAATARPGDIVMLSSTHCGICTRARQWFQEHGVAFDECFVENNAACAERFQRLMAPGTPVIIVRGRAQLGFDPQRIAAQMSATEGAR
ncbi:MAG: glutaredoxin family protein [Rubrivivax sp.]|nr:glutaredoxin family protein [Rubrivivax sp.]